MLIERIKDEWAQERRALEEFNRLPYSILGAAHGV